jgi:hypothetical protein
MPGSLSRSETGPCTTKPSNRSVPMRVAKRENECRTACRLRIVEQVRSSYAGERSDAIAEPELMCFGGKPSKWLFLQEKATLNAVWEATVTLVPL